MASSAEITLARNEYLRDSGSSGPGRMTPTLASDLISWNAAIVGRVHCFGQPKWRCFPSWLRPGACRNVFTRPGPLIVIPLSHELCQRAIQVSV